MATVKPDWKMPSKPIETCYLCGGADISPQACAEGGDGWELYWGCDDCGNAGFGELNSEQMDTVIINWPFGDDDRASPAEMEAIGFDVV